MDWQPLPKPSELAENRLIQAILDGHFPIGTTLPGERDLASMLGVTRPTMREALQRLARDGWVEIRHGHATRVRDYWREGQLAVLVAMVQRPEQLPADIVPNLLAVRLAMAPAYASQAVARNAEQVVKFMQGYPQLADTPEAFTNADWDLHHTLTVLSGNPVYTLILNGFGSLYKTMGLRYFTNPQARLTSHKFYLDLLAAAQKADFKAAATIVSDIMAQSIQFWERVDNSPGH
jgi:GntR family transcriptional regulator, negative regulator for fad regulon and positive regulator of fabA